MPLRIANRFIYEGSVTTEIGVEKEFFSLDNQLEIYLLEGYLDLDGLATGDEVEIIEKMSVDGTKLSTFAQASYTPENLKRGKILRFTVKNFKNKVSFAIKQTKGSPKSFPYWFIHLPLEVI